MGNPNPSHPHDSDGSCDIVVNKNTDRSLAYFDLFHSY
jgi:hypothetical protein